MTKTIGIVVVRLGEYLCRFGWRGILLALVHQLKLKGGKHSEPVCAYVPKIGPVYMRPHSSDLATFREVFINGEYDFETCGLAPALHNRYEKILADGRRPIILDAGGNIGLSSLYLSQYFPKALVILVEANSGSAAVARANAAIHGNWEIHEVALWDRSCRLGLTASSDESTREVLEIDEAAAVETIPARTPNEILGSRVNDLFMVKMDIEGAERRVLSNDLGACDWLSNAPVIMVEPHDGIFNPRGSLSGLLDRPEYRDGAIIPNGATLLFMPRGFGLG